MRKLQDARPGLGGTHAVSRIRNNGTADVDPAPVAIAPHVQGMDAHATAGQSFTDVIAVVLASGPSASDLSVTVNWGDQTTDSNVQVIPFGPEGVFRFDALSVTPHRPTSSTSGRSSGHRASWDKWVSGLKSHGHRACLPTDGELRSPTSPGGAGDPDSPTARLQP
jgi:hypothetical protein